jgi:hypothetical protein
LPPLAAEAASAQPALVAAAEAFARLAAVRAWVPAVWAPALEAWLLAVAVLELLVLQPRVSGLLVLAELLAWVLRPVSARQICLSRA